MRAQTQGDLVVKDQGFKTKEEVRVVGLPGIAQLHTRSTEEIAEVLAVVLKSERNVVRLNWDLAEGKMELTIRHE